MDQVHGSDFLWEEERKLLHQFMMLQNEAFAWEENEKGKFNEEMFPPVKMAVVPHVPWVQKNIHFRLLLDHTYLV